MRHRFMRFPGGKPKCVTLSYDDGFHDDLDLAALADKYGLKVTFNITGSIASEALMTKEEVQAGILDKGHELAVHGYNHKPNGNLRPVEGVIQVLDNKRAIEDMFGIIVRGMAYPGAGITRFSNGVTYEDVKSYLVSLDIVYARTLGPQRKDYMMPQDWHRWLPTLCDNNPEAMDFIDTFVKLDMKDFTPAQQEPRLFYMYGHSYCFRENNNWDYCEKLFSALSGHDDIWYATNMEIYNYTKAYESLIFNSNGTVVYNPTAYTIWFEVERQPRFVAAGETKRI